MPSDETVERKRAFAEALRDALKVQNVTQVELARRLGGTQGMVSNWLTGRASPEMPEDAFAVERALGVPLGSLSIHLGYLPPEALTEPSVARAVMSDKLIDADQKAMIMASYQSALERNESKKKVSARKAAARPAKRR